MNKLIKSALVLTLIAAGILGLVLRPSRTKQAGHTTIGILQFVSHPALDEARRGFVSRMKEFYADNVTIITQNAEGSMMMAQSIAERFHADASLDAMFAIATPAAQAMHAAEHVRPVAIAAVTDPAAAGLIAPGGNVCGSCDIIDTTALVDLLLTLVPAARRIGILFSPSEINSVLLADRIRDALKAAKREALDVGLGDTANLPLTISVACQKVDALIAPTDNTVAASIEIITQEARRHKTPLIIGFGVTGALATQGVDYARSGAQAAERLRAVLAEAKKPSDLPIAGPDESLTTIDEQLASELGLAIPTGLVYQPSTPTT